MDNELTDSEERFQAARHVDKRRFRRAFLSYVCFVASVLMPVIILIGMAIFVQQDHAMYRGVAFLLFVLALAVSLVVMVGYIVGGVIFFRSARFLARERDRLLDMPRTAPPTEKPRAQKEKPELKEAFDAGSALGNSHK